MINWFQKYVDKRCKLELLSLLINKDTTNIYKCILIITMAI